MVAQRALCLLMPVVAAHLLVRITGSGSADAGQFSVDSFDRSGPFGLVAFGFVLVVADDPPLLHVVAGVEADFLDAQVVGHRPVTAGPGKDFVGAG